MPPTVLEIIMDHTRAQKVAISHSEREKTEEMQKSQEMRSHIRNKAGDPLFAIEEKWVGRIHLVRVHTYGK